jgi:mRNA interferase RelE/StbE
LFNKFNIAETESFQKNLKNTNFSKIYSKIRKFVYPQLRKNPYFGPNIKKLKGEFEGLYRFRIGDNRLFYSIDNEKIIVFILALKQRKDAY